MQKPKIRHPFAALGISILSMMPLAALAQGPQIQLTPPPQGDRGPAILVPTDVVGGHGFNAPSEMVDLPSIRVGRFHPKPDAKKFLIETTTDTTCKTDGAEVTLDNGQLLVFPKGGHIVIHTPSTDVVVPHDTVALVEYSNECSRVLNLAGHYIVVRVLETDKAHTKDALAIEPGLGYMDAAGSDNLPKGTGLLDKSITPEVVLQLAKVKHFEMLEFDPMKLLQNHQIMKQLKQDWLPAMKKVEHTSERLILERERLSRVLPNKPQ